MTVLSAVIQRVDGWKPEERLSPVRRSTEVKGVGTERGFRWIQIDFQPEGARRSLQMGNFVFTGSDEAANRAAYTRTEGASAIGCGDAGTSTALACGCIHGAWHSSR